MSTCKNCDAIVDIIKAELCKSCYQRQWKENNLERVKIHKASDYKRNKKGYLRRAKKSTAKRKQATGITYCRKTHLKNTYGITEEDYKQKLEAQNYRCAICNSDDPGHGAKHFMIDHDHQTEKVRGLLCRGCNTALGTFRDSIDILNNAIDYLEKHR